MSLQAKLDAFKADFEAGKNNEVQRECRRHKGSIGRCRKQCRDRRQDVVFDAIARDAIGSG